MRNVIQQGKNFRIESDTDWPANRRKAVISLADMNYQEGSAWLPVEEIFEPDGQDGFTLQGKRAKHRIRIDNSANRRWYPRSEIESEYLTAGRPQYFGQNQWRNLLLGSIVQEQGSISMENSDVKVTILFLWNRVKLDILLKNSNAPTQFRFPISLTGLAMQAGRLISNNDASIVGQIGLSTAFDALGAPVELIEDISESAIIFTVIPGEASVYPIEIDPTLEAVGPTSDTQVNSNAVDNNYGTSLTLQLGTSRTRKVLWRFSLAGIPASATCDSATLKIYKGHAEGYNNLRSSGIYMPALENRDWVGGTKSDALAGTGESCWNWKGYNTVAWLGTAGLNTAGTDYESTALGTYNWGTGDIVGTQYAITLDAARIEPFFNGDLSLLGINTSGDYCTICSSEHATTGYRPVLEIYYTDVTGNVYEETLSLGIALRCAQQSGNNETLALAREAGVAITSSAIIEETISLGKANGIYVRRHGQVEVPVAGDFTFDSNIISLASEGDWDEIYWGGVPGTLVHHLGKYYFYYVGAKTDGDPNWNVQWRGIGVATSPDGVTWTKHASNPIITYTTTGNVEDEEGASNPVVLIIGETWHMWYGASRYTSPTNVDVDIRYRTSVDGINWTGDTLVYSNAGDEFVPINAFYEGGNYHLYYIGPLTSGAGNYRHRWGTSPTSLTNDELLLTGSYRAARGTNDLDEGTVLLTFQLSSMYQMRTVERSAPGTISANLEAWAITGYGRGTIYLDWKRNQWLLVQEDVNTGHLALHTATIIQEWDGRAPVDETISLARQAGIAPQAGLEAHHTLQLGKQVDIALQAQSVLQDSILMSRSEGINTAGQIEIAHDFSLAKQVEISAVSSRPDIQEFITLARQAGFDLQSQINAGNVITLGTARAVDFVPQGILYETITFVREAGVNANYDIPTIEEYISLARQAGIQATANAIAESSIILGRQTGVSATSQAVTQNSIQLGLLRAILVTDTRAPIFETITLDRFLSQAISSQSTVNDQLTLSTSRGIQLNSQGFMEELLQLAILRELGLVVTRDEVFEILSLGKGLTIASTPHVNAYESINLFNYPQIAVASSVEAHDTFLLSKNVGMQVSGGISVEDQLALARIAGFSANADYIIPMGLSLAKRVGISASNVLIAESELNLYRVLAANFIGASGADHVLAPPEQTLIIAKEVRVFVIDKEIRIFAIDYENRVYEVKR